MPWRTHLWIALVAGQLALAQPPAAFEAISIKPNRSGGESSDTNTSPGRLRLINATPISLIRRAFGIQDPQIIGAPEWTSTERYDIVAVTGGADRLTDQQRQPFFQAMLADRWQFRYHRETKTLRAYALVISKNGPKITTHAGPGTYSMKLDAGPDGFVIHSTRGNIPRLVEILGRLTGRIVTDETALAGEYDFTLKWAPDQQPGALGPSLFNALEEQLGLRLESVRKPIAVIVIDHIERPSAN